MTTLRTTLTEQPTLEFAVARKQFWLFASIGIVGLALFILGFAVSDRPAVPTMPLLVGFLMAGWAAKARPFQVFEDRLEFKAAPLAATKIIDFDEIEELIEPKVGKATLRRVGDPRGKGVRLPLHLLEPADRERLLDAIDARIPA